MYLNQIAYIEKFLHEFAMKHDKAKSIVISVNNYDVMRKTTIDDESDDRNVYCRRIKSIMFAMIYTRPDICFALTKLSAYMSNSEAHHDIAVKHVLRYFKFTASLCLRYESTRAFDKIERMKVFIDSDFASDKDDRRSVLEYIVMLGEEAVS